MNHASAVERPDFGAFAVRMMPIRPSQLQEPGEVSKCGAGGARNRADRESAGLKDCQVTNLVEAARMAHSIGLPLNRFITVHWEATGLSLDHMVRATGRFVDLLTKWLRRRGHRTAWIWVHENGNDVGGHCHLLVNVPPHCVGELVAVQKSWLRRISGRPYRPKTIRSIPVGRRLGLETSNPALFCVNHDELVEYVSKGAKNATSRWRQPGGRVVGKRCGTSQNIGAKARG